MIFSVDDEKKAAKKRAEEEAKRAAEEANTQPKVSTNPLKKVWKTVSKSLRDRRGCRFCRRNPAADETDETDGDETDSEDGDASGDETTQEDDGAEDNGWGTTSEGVEGDEESDDSNTAEESADETIAKRQVVHDTTDSGDTWGTPETDPTPETVEDLCRRGWYDNRFGRGRST